MIDMLALYARLDSLYPGRWQSAVGTDSRAETWAETWAAGLEQHGITEDDIADAILSRRMPDWPPSLPEFIRACRPIPDAETAFLEAISQYQIRLDNPGADRWSHPAIFWAAQKIGAAALRTAVWRDIRARWTTALSQALDAPYRPVPPAPRLVASAPHPVDQQQVAQARERFAQIVASVRHPHEATFHNVEKA